MEFQKVKKFPLLFRIPITGIGLVLCIPATVFLLDHDETEVCVLEESMRVIFPSQGLIMFSFTRLTSIETLYVDYLYW